MHTHHCLEHVLLPLIITTYLSGCQSLSEPVISRKQKLTFSHLRTLPPQNWTWDEQHNWYRSPNKQFLWINGEKVISIEAMGFEHIKDSAIYGLGSSNYAPKIALLY